MWRFVFAFCKTWVESIYEPKNPSPNFFLPYQYCGCALLLAIRFGFVPGWMCGRKQQTDATDPSQAIE